MCKVERYIVTLALCSLFLVPAKASDTLLYTLQQCRELALTQSASSKSQEESRLAAKFNRQAALAAMFPRITANAAYMWNNAQVHLLPNTADFTVGTATVNPDGTASFKWNEEIPSSTITDEAGQRIADGYKAVYDKFSPDLTHVLVAHVGVTQPIYVGGRLVHLYKIAKATENIATIESESRHDETIYNVDEAYWRVVSVSKKKELAEQYFQLLVQLERDVQEAIAGGLATQSDLLQVMTKRGDAEVKKLQAENGLTLSNMALAQLCGLPLSTGFILDETGLDETTLPTDSISTEAAVANRTELRLMEQAQQIAKSNAMIMAAGFQPNIVASAGYTYTNPNADNGFSSNWDGKGFFSAGVVVNLPIAHADDILRYKAAKHAANAIVHKTEETRELLTLQITQANQKLTEAQQKIALARLTQNNAAEVLRMAQESFAAGLITASELMQAQTAWLAAASELVDAQVQAKTTETQLRKYLRKL